MMTNTTGYTSPAEGAFSVTPNDSVNLNQYTRSIYIGTLGDVRVDMVSGETVTFSGVSGILPVRVKRIYSTGTTASGIIGLY